MFVVVFVSLFVVVVGCALLLFVDCRCFCCVACSLLLSVFVVCCWLLVVRCWLLFVACCLLMLFVVCCWFFVNCCLSLSDCCSSVFVVWCLLFDVVGFGCCWLVVAGVQLLAFVVAIVLCVLFVGLC